MTTTFTANQTAADSFDIFRSRDGKAPTRIGTVFHVERTTGKSGWLAQAATIGQKRSRVLDRTAAAAAERRWGTPARDAVIAAAKPTRSQDILDDIEVRP